MSEGDFIGRLEGQITFKAELPQEFYDKILGNTPEEMARMLQPGYAFDLSDGKDRSVTYIAFPAGTKPDDVLRPEDFLPAFSNSESRPDDLIIREH